MLTAAARRLPAEEWARYAEKFQSELWEIAQVGGRCRALPGAGGVCGRQVLAARRLRAGLRVPRCRGAVL